MSGATEQPTRPEVSVVIPTHDRWPLLARALACVRRQESVDLEIVVVDDGCVDGTGERVRAIDDPRIRIVRHERALGLAQARNAGIRVARGEWIAFLDDDDLWSPHKLHRQLEAARDACAGWCYCGTALVDARLRVGHVAPPPSPESLGTRLRGVNALAAGASNVVVRADLLDCVGHFDEVFRHFADWDLWLRLTAAGKPATVEPPLVAYLQHPGNLRFKEPGVLLGELARLDRKHGLAGDAEPERFKVLRWIGEAQWQAGRRADAARTFARLLRCRPRASEAVWVARHVRPRRGGAGRSAGAPDAIHVEWLEPPLRRPRASRLAPDPTRPADAGPGAAVSPPAGRSAGARPRRT